MVFRMFYRPYSDNQSPKKGTIMSNSLATTDDSASFLKKAALTTLGVVGAGAALYGLCYFGAKRGSLAALSSGVLRYDITLTSDGEDVPLTPID